MSDSLLASSFGVDPAKPDNTVQLALAINAAKLAATELILPAGLIRADVPPIAVADKLSIRGLGSELTVIQPIKSVDGLVFQPTPNTGSVWLSGVSIVAAKQTTGTGLAIDCGPYSVNNARQHLRDVKVVNFKNGFMLRNVWNSSFSDLFADGGPGGTAGAGAGLAVVGCFNCTFSGLCYLQSFGYGVFLDNAGQGMQGLDFYGLRVVECLRAFGNVRVDGTDTGPHGAIGLHGAMIDNGDAIENGKPVYDNYASISLKGVDAFSMVGGSVWQAGGPWMAFFNGCTNPRLVGVNMNGQFYVGQGAVGAIGTKGLVVTSGSFGPANAVELGGDTSACVVQSNAYPFGSKNVNYGTRNEVENT